MCTIQSMQNYRGEVFTLINGESYIILNSKKKLQKDYCLAIPFKPSADSAGSFELEVIVAYPGEGDDLMAGIYIGADCDEIRRELLGYDGDDKTKIGNKITDFLELIRTEIKQDNA